MKAYTIGFPGGAPTPLPDDVDRIVLGAPGRGQSEVIVPIVPAVNAGTDEYGVRKTPHGVVVVRGGGQPDDRRCLAVINAVGSYDRRRCYDILDAVGVTVLVAGRHSFGDAGRINGGPHALCLIEPGASFRLNDKYSSTMYAWTGEAWVVATPGEHAARKAAEEFAAGGGEWL